MRALSLARWLWLWLPQGGAGGGDAATTAEQITALYAEHNPSKLDSVPALLEKYAANLDGLLASVREKYTSLQQAEVQLWEEVALASPVESAGPGLGAAVRQLNRRQLGAADMAGLLGRAALPVFLERWASAPLHASAVHSAAETAAIFSGSALHAVLAADRAPKSVHVRDGFGFDVEGLEPASDKGGGPGPFAAYLAGGTIFMNFVERHSPPVGALTCWLGAALGTRAQTNAYLTPPGAQGFTAHTDSQDVLILQLEGLKRWR